MTGTPGPRTDRVRVLTADAEPGPTVPLSAGVTGAARWPSAVAAGWGAPRAARAPYARVIEGRSPGLDGGHASASGVDGRVRRTAAEPGPTVPLSAAFTGAARWPSAVAAGWGAPRAARARRRPGPQELQGGHPQVT
ncbi:hypothetical protein ABZX30_37035, partial [Streptomyces sp. NPDC004542]